MQVNRAMQTQIEKLQSQLQDVQAKLSAEKAAKVDMAAEQHEEEVRHATNSVRATCTLHLSASF